MAGRIPSASGREGTAKLVHGSVRNEPQPVRHESGFCEIDDQAESHYLHCIVAVFASCYSSFFISSEFPPFFFFAIFIQMNLNFF
jgi:hypothetical protein